MLPDFLIIGAARSGTTWLSRNLAVHPQLFIPDVKEVHFFDRRYETGLAAYEQEFAGAEPGTLVGEATPAYLHTPQVAARIKEHLPNARLIAILRDPVDRLYSRYWNAKGKFEKNADLEFEDKLREKPEFIEEGYYIDHIERYRQLFPAEQMHFALHDDIKNSGQQLLSDVYRFLGVDADFESPLIESKINTAGSQKLLAKSKFRYHLTRVAKKLGLWSLERQLEASNRAEIPKLEPEIRQRILDDYYREKNQRLAQLLERDLSHWGT